MNADIAGAEAIYSNSKRFRYFVSQSGSGGECEVCKGNCSTVSVQCEEISFALPGGETKWTQHGGSFVNGHSDCLASVRRE